MLEAEWQRLPSLSTPYCIDCKVTNSDGRLFQSVEREDLKGKSSVQGGQASKLTVLKVSVNVLKGNDREKGYQTLKATGALRFTRVGTFLQPAGLFSSKSTSFSLHEYIVRFTELWVS